MRKLARYAKDESGIVLPLVMVMITLIAVMGAGLLVFVTRDLNAVVEVNRGQKALEMADAGVRAAGRQLSADVVRTSYDGDGFGNCAADDIQWSALLCTDPGLTLNNLDGNTSTADSVLVTIEYRAEAFGIPEHFVVVSTGTYGNAKRKIEARFNGVPVASGGGDSIGHPLYYTPSDIRIERTVDINAISMFSGGDILIEGVTDPESFVREYEDNRSGGTLKFAIKDDALCDWNSAAPLHDRCFVRAEGNWNTVGRTITERGDTDAFQKPGFAAEGKICGFPTGSVAKGVCGDTESAADGVYGYDSTTGSQTMPHPTLLHSWGNNLKFEDKGNLLDNPADTISYPFPRPTPIPEGFKEQACKPLTLAACTPTTGNDYFEGSPAPEDWEDLLDSNNNKRIAFVDARNQTLNFDTSGSEPYKGILVVWCGDLQQNQSFSGIVLNLRGDGSSFGSTDCADNPTKGVYRNNGQNCQCWMYAEGGTANRAGIELAHDSKITFRPSGDWSFLNSLFESPPPTSFALDSWREVYQ